MAGETREGRVEGRDFIRAIVARHQEDGTYGGRVETRFPPEPNGYLHIGHTRAIVLNFGLAAENGGVCHLRFDDTNPLTEDMKYVRAIQEDIRWLGFDWGEHLYFASDYFDRLFDSALILIRKGKAYVDSQSEEEIREKRGTVTEPGRESPFRDRSVGENLDLFQRMKAGEFRDGEHVLRAKIDMAHPNMIMRDPVFYRIRHASHYRRGDEWCVYPLYDFTHCLSDAFEDVTHSLCSLEFENNREIYDWILNEVGFEEPRTHQYEFGRMNLEYTVVSKRKLLRLVDEGYVDGWDDPRMPTLAGMRRRGVPPEAVRSFTESVGVAKVNNRVDLAKLEFAIRDHLNRTVPRVMGVLKPLRVVITNYPEGEAEELEIPSYPHDVPLDGTRRVPFSRELLIESDDFLEDPPRGYHRLAPGREVRLRYAYFIRCEEVVKDSETGEVLELRCTYDRATKGGSAPDGRKVKGTIHWVSAGHALKAKVRLYDRLFSVPDPEGAGEGKEFTEYLNTESRVVLEEAWIEPSVASDPPGTRYQFERLGYFMTDLVDSGSGCLAFNRIVTLKDTWTRRMVDRSAVAVTPREVTGPKATPSGTLPGDGPGKPAEEPHRAHRNTGKEERGRARKKHPVLAERFARYQEDLGLGEEDADILTGSPELSAFFEDALAEGVSPARLANWMVNELLRELKDRSLSALPVAPASLASLVALVESGTISQAVAKEVFGEMVASGADPGTVVKERGLERVKDAAALVPLVEKALAAYPEKVEEYRGGKRGLLGFFTGQVMKETGGRADARTVQNLLRERLDV
ncbi:glutamine--tRNA ligase/YqeY domain fusion protein [Gemmatimonadota bacterium]